MLEVARSGTAVGGAQASIVWQHAQPQRLPFADASFDAVICQLQRICGPDLAAASATAYSLGEPTLLRALFRQAEIPRISMSTHESIVRFPSNRFCIHARINGWMLVARVKHEHFAHLLAEAERELAGFAAIDGTVAFLAPAHLIVVTRAAAPT